MFSATIHLAFAGVAHLVERDLAKVEVASSSLVARSKKKHHPSGWCFLFGMSRAGLNLLPRPARSALNQEVRQGSCEWLCHSWDAGSESSLVARSKTERHPCGVSFFFGAALLLRKSGRLRAGDGTRVGEPVKGSPLTLPLPCGGRECRQQNLWTITKRNTIRQDGVFFLECRGQV